jgi:DNA-binding transcriptional regulator YhcF (GntR family)
MFDLITIDEHSRVPKYKQIVDGITENISAGKLMLGEKIPSINAFSERFDLSRDTVEKAYNILKDRKVISSVRGKGYYVTRTVLLGKINVFFLINKLSSYKMRIYNAFVNRMGANAHTDLHIYHCDEMLFLNLLRKNLGGYDYYVVMPHFKTNALKHISATDEIVEAINEIPREKLILLDNNKMPLEDIDIQIFQDFKEDIYTALKEGLDKITGKYTRLILSYPQKSVYPYPKRILHGFRKFCVEFDLPFEIVDEIFDDMILKKGDLFITIVESDLVNLVKQIRDIGFTPGKEIGVISYNDTLLKELLGITVISTDFEAMGVTAADMILNKKKGLIKNPFNFIDRKSI